MTRANWRSTGEPSIVPRLHIRPKTIRRGSLLAGGRSGGPSWATGLCGTSTCAVWKPQREVPGRRARSAERAHLRGAPPPGAVPYRSHEHGAQPGAVPGRAVRRERCKASCARAASCAPATCLHWACAVGAPCRARCAARSASGSSPCPCAPQHATHGPVRREQTSCETVPVLGARLMAQCCDSPVRMWAGSIAGGGSGMRRGGNQARRAVERHRQLDPRLCARQRQ
jgi:hypothetical protein